MNLCTKKPINLLLRHTLYALLLFCGTISFGQDATSTIPVSIGRPCGSSAGTKDSVMYFTYDRNTSTISRLSSCKPSLSSPGLSSSATSITFNPADGYIYLIRYKSSSGVYSSYVWRWQPGTCPASSLALYQTYTNQIIAGLDFDASGMGYQIIFTGSAPYNMYLQQVNVSTGTLGPLVSVDLQGKNIYTQNGDLVITPSGQFLTVWDNKYFSINYKDYNTATPLKATYIDTLPLSGSAHLVGLSYAQGKLVGSTSKDASGSCGYYDFDILTGNLTPLSVGSGSQYSADMTNITSGVGAAKELVSATPVSDGVYDLTYDIRVENVGDYPVSNFQVTEDLTTINPLGSAAISNVTTSWIYNPTGITKNSSYDGVTNKNLISTSPSQTLPNYPTANNYCIIRVSFRMSSVESGVVYYNNAVVTGKGYNNVSLMDSSTNGEEPDLNSNNIPDDVGEDQSTPFSISVAAETPPCASIESLLYSQDFGTGTGTSTTLPGTVTTDYSAGSNPMNEETYMLTNNANNGNTSKYLSITDHTGNSNGRMLLVNADVKNNKLFEDQVSITCANMKYSFIAYASNVINTTYSTFCDAFGGAQPPSLTFVVRNAATNTIIASYSSGNITSSSWTMYGMKWVMPAGVTDVILQVYNTGAGGCGNVVALDDIQFGVCDPLPVVSASLPSAGCIGSSTTLTTTFSDTTNLSGYLSYQWQSSTNNSAWTNISGAQSASYTINPVAYTDQKYYRIVVTASGNSGNSACQSISNSIFLNVKDYSTAANSIGSNSTVICPGIPVDLYVNGGSLGTNAQWVWYQNSCGGSYYDTGPTTTIVTNGITTFYVRAEGDCNTTNCVSILVPQNCVLADQQISLNGTYSYGISYLKWKFTGELNLQSIQLERSVNATTFTSIATIPVNDNTFSYSDNNGSLNSDVVYYRIKAVDKNGKILYSNILQIKPDKTIATAIISPNPAHNKAYINLYANMPGFANVHLYNDNGQLLFEQNNMVHAGQNQILLSDLDKLHAGVYSVVITNNKEIVRLKIFIQN